MDKYIQFFKHHERLFLCLIAVLGIGYIAHRYFSNSVELAKLSYEDAKKTRDTQTEQNKILAEKSAKDSLDYALLKTQLAIAQAQRDQAIAQRDTALKTQQVKNDSLPLPDLGIRWAGLVGALPGVDIKPLPEGLLITSTASHITVNMLEQVPVLKQDLVDKTIEVADKKKQIDGLQKAFDSKDAELTGCKAEIKAADKECTKQIDLVKAQKSRKNIFFQVLSFIAGVALGHKF